MEQRRRPPCAFSLGADCLRDCTALVGRCGFFPEHEFELSITSTCGPVALFIYCLKAPLEQEHSKMVLEKLSMLCAGGRPLAWKRRLNGAAESAMCSNVDLPGAPGWPALEPPCLLWPGLLRRRRAGARDEGRGARLARLVRRVTGAERERQSGGREEGVTAGKRASVKRPVFSTRTA